MSDPIAISTIDLELGQGRLARMSGNEGRARVHARRAAGWAIGLSARRKGTDPGTRSALRLLQWFAHDPAVDVDLRQAAGRLTTQITPDHNLPYPQDPLEDAELIIQACLPELIGDSERARRGDRG